MITDIFTSFSKYRRFNDLCRTVKCCTLCERLTNRTRVLSRANGNIDTKVVFVAEAPGRLGADRTGIPLCGDRTGDIFESLIGNIGWTREQIFITNALLCNPRNENGNNTSPSRKELINCAAYLRMTLEIIKPSVVVPLGIHALEALKYICTHNIVLRTNVGKLITWNDINIFPLYHPGPRALIHRSLAKQRNDYMALARRIDPLKGIKVKTPHKVETQFLWDEDESTILQDMAMIFLKQLKTLSLFKLTKLFYLTDLKAIYDLGRSLSGEIYLRQQEGPWIPNIGSKLRSLENRYINIFFKGNKPYVSLNTSSNYESMLNEKELSIIISSIAKYGKLSDSRIKTVVYLSEPMRYILKEEKKGKKYYNKPVLDNNKICISN
jgi:uracil-DNA glycosylase family 4